jgi:serine protease Do
VADTRIGSKVSLVVLRDGKRVPLAVTLAERPGDVVAQARPTPEEESLAGLKVRDLTDAERRAAKVESGITITEVEEGSMAEDAGLQPGDIIEQLGGKPVASVDAFARMIKEARSSRRHHAALLVSRQGQSRFIAMRLAE